MPDSKKLAVSLVHLGCCKNLVDSEKILGKLGMAGYPIAQYPEDSDIVLVNTCGFIESARAEARTALKKMIDLKKNNKVKAVVVIGCMVQLYAKELLLEFPKLDGCIGFSDYEKIDICLEQILNKKQTQFQGNKNFIPKDDLRLRVTPPNYAYLRITEGCSNWCSYCSIPKIRGEMRSKPLDQLLEEAKILIADGAKEIIVIGQDTGSYGKDLTEKTDLYELVHRLAELQDLKWLRIMYIHPNHFKDHFIKLFQIPQVVHYLEMPIQHIHPRILQEMGRGHNDILVKELIEKIRKDIPDIILRSTVMVGFPGETDEEFQTLLDFIQQAKFERLGAFIYSKEPGTKAEHISDNISNEIKQQRYNKIMAAQQKIAFQWAQSMIGKKLEVVLEEPINKNLWNCRSYGEAPEIDPSIHIQAKKNMYYGDYCTIKIIEAKEYDLIGQIVSPKR